MKSNLASKSETSGILGELESQWGMGVPRCKNVMVHELGPGEEIVTGEGLAAVRTGGRYYPFLTQTELLGRFARVTVDMGAVRFMCKGANLMRPGITSFTEFEKGQTVCIVEESQGKFLAVGTASVPSSELDTMERGEVVQNAHYVSDRFWEAGKEMR